MKQKLTAIFALSMCLGLAGFSQESLAEECIILLHGLARSDNSMAKMAEALEDASYRVVNFDYPSTEYAIEELASTHLPQAIEQCSDSTTLGFVTHSLGGIILRQYLSQNEIKNLGRVVMLGPPNQGSEVVDTLRDVPGYELFNGPAGMQLGTEETSVPNTLGPADFELGIIAGSKSMNVFLSQLLPNPDDGKVSVARTKLDGMTDHITVHVSHPFMMRDKEVIYQTMQFLENGAFDKEEEE